MHLLNIAGRFVHYQYHFVAKDRPSIVMINSLGTDFRIWSFVVQQWQGAYNLLLFDKSGHGLSTHYQAQYTIGDFAEDLRHVMEHLKISRATLIGLSIGGLIAQHLYHAYPELVARLVLTNTGTKIGHDEMWDTRMAAVRDHGLASIADAVLERWFSPNLKAHYPERFDAAKTMLLQTPDAGYVAACLALRAADYTALAAQIAVPCLCIAGSDDQATPPAMVQAMHRAIPHSRYCLIEGSGHLPCWEAEKVFCANVSGFMQDS